MKKLCLVLFLVCIAMVIGISVTLAKSKTKLKKAETNAFMKNIEDLFFISQDLDENTLIYIKPDKCFCSCRGTMWSCTDVSCEKHFKECQNPLPETASPTQTTNFIPSVDPVYQSQSVPLEPNPPNEVGLNYPEVVLGN